MSPGGFKSVGFHFVLPNLQETNPSLVRRGIKIERTENNCALLDRHPKLSRGECYRLHYSLS